MGPEELLAVGILPISGLLRDLSLLPGVAWLACVLLISPLVPALSLLRGVEKFGAA